MIEVILSAVAVPPVGTGGGLDVGRGAIAGALIVGAAFLAGQAVLRRSVLAGFAFAMLAFAGAYCLSAMGLLGEAGARTTLLFLCLFGASALLFVSSAIRPVRTSGLLSGAMFTGALTLGGIGVFTVFSPADMSGIVRTSMILTAAASAGFAALFLRSDQGARILLPGVAIASLAPLVAFATGGGFSLAAFAVFAVGVISSSLVAMIEGASGR
ncbi:MAG: hypothetical protein K2Q06_10000, partial [Parvularculaceae bacterium]|nr:hypothetical protein [Parvularculaceae bacterium]